MCVYIYTYRYVYIYTHRHFFREPVHTAEPRILKF